MSIKFDIKNTGDFLSCKELEYFGPFVDRAHSMLHEKSGQGNGYLGWVDLPVNYDKEELERIKQAAEKIRSESEVFIVTGIGGSYLGSRAAIEALTHSFHNMLPSNKRNGPEIYFAGNNISSTYLADLLEVIDGKEVSINVISKSGTTIEPAITFRILKDYMEKKYGTLNAGKRIYATTDKSQGVLKKLADSKNYEYFVIPGNIGGRFSVSTAVGLLPMAVAGIDVDGLLSGAAKGYELYQKPFLDNPSYIYAAARNALYRKMKTVEIMVSYEPSLHYFTEWWKQLFGESEGKDGKGIFPAVLDFTTDLHSMGQYIQDGLRNIFETVLRVEKPGKDIKINEDVENLDKLNFLAGKTMDFVNKKALDGTMLAHQDGGVPNFLVKIPEMTPYYFGQLVYFFEKACGISGYLSGVNPFDQPGVEAYKRNMFALLGKPEYEKEKEILERRLYNNSQ